MDIARLSQAAILNRRNYDRTVYVSHVAPLSAAELASIAIEKAMAEGRPLSMPITGRKVGPTVDLNTLTANAAPVEIGAGRGRKAAIVTFSEDIDLDAFIDDADIRRWSRRNTLRFTLDAETVGFSVEGSVKNPAGAAARYLRDYFADLHGWKVSAVPRGTTIVDFKVREEVKDEESTDSE